MNTQSDANFGAEAGPDQKIVDLSPPAKHNMGGRSPFKSGFVPNGKKGRPKGSGGSTHLTKRSLLKLMLETDITVKDLPVALADKIRKRVPGFFDNVDRKFTFYQIMEMTQLQLLFSKSDHVKQNAIIAIKDRVEGKPMQKIQVESGNVEPTEFMLPGGRKLVI